MVAASNFTNDCHSDFIFPVTTGLSHTRGLLVWSLFFNESNVSESCYMLQIWCMEISYYLSPDIYTNNDMSVISSWRQISGCTCAPDMSNTAGNKVTTILPALPSSSSGQGGPTGTRGLSHAEISLVALDNHQSYKTQRQHSVNHLCNDFTYWWFTQRRGIW